MTPVATAVATAVATSTVAIYNMSLSTPTANITALKSTYDTFLFYEMQKFHVEDARASFLQQLKKIQIC